MRLSGSILIFVLVAWPVRAADKSQPARVIGDPSEFFTTASYPDKARDNGEQGPVAARIELDSRGYPTGCSIVESSKSVLLDEATCRIARQRLQFTAAKDVKGRNIPSQYTLRVNWQLPYEAKIPIDLKDGRRKVVDATVEYQVDAQGSATACKLVSAEQDSPNPCLGFDPKRNVRFPPATIDGEPSASIYIVRSIVIVDRPDPVGPPR